ncbi:hypothetical protein GCK32_001517 [Trichostrongylus colubriformis]|uniref:Uncharacterized protein n=1 Tax=Trichostrongylus colubriformis TaxID=6319 RepID=A0AAN8IRH8_TRICO
METKTMLRSLINSCSSCYHNTVAQQIPVSPGMFFKNALNFVINRRKSSEENVLTNSDEAKSSLPSSDSKTTLSAEKKGSKIIGSASASKEKFSKPKTAPASPYARKKELDKSPSAEHNAKKRDSEESGKGAGRTSSDNKMERERLAQGKGSIESSGVRQGSGEKPTLGRMTPRKQIEESAKGKRGEEQPLRVSGDESAKMEKKKGEIGKKGDDNLAPKKETAESETGKRPTDGEEEIRLAKLRELVVKKKEQQGEREDREFGELAKVSKQRQSPISPKKVGSDVRVKLDLARKKALREQLQAKAVEGIKAKSVSALEEKLSSREKRKAQRKPARPPTDDAKTQSLPIAAHKSDSRIALKKKLVAGDKMSREKSTRSRREKPLREKSTRSRREKRKKATVLQAEQTQEDISRKSIRAKKASSTSMRISKLKKKLLSREVMKDGASRELPDIEIPEMYRKKIKKKPQDAAITDIKDSDDSGTDYWLYPAGKPKKDLEICEIPSEGEQNYGDGRLPPALARGPPTVKVPSAPDHQAAHIEQGPTPINKMTHVPEVYGVFDRPPQQPAPKVHGIDDRPQQQKHVSPDGHGVDHPLQQQPVPPEAYGVKDRPQQQPAALSQIRQPFQLESPKQGAANGNPTPMQLNSVNIAPRERR